jgi:hypothetical protein
VKEKLDIPAVLEHTHNVTRLGNSTGTRPIFVKFKTFSKKLEVLRNMSKLAASASSSSITCRYFYLCH